MDKPEKILLPENRRSLSFLLLLLHLVFFSCQNPAHSDLEKSSQEANAPEFVRALFHLKPDGYEWGGELQKKYIFPLDPEKVEGQDYYLYSYSEQSDIRDIKDRMQRKFPDEQAVNDRLLGLTAPIKAVHISKQFGSKWHYEKANIRIEEWEYPDTLTADRALTELNRVSEWGFDKNKYVFFRCQKNVYFFYVWESSKRSELKRVAAKLKQHLQIR